MNAATAARQVLARTQPFDRDCILIWVAAVLVNRCCVRLLRSAEQNMLTTAQHQSKMTNAPAATAVG